MNEMEFMLGLGGPIAGLKGILRCWNVSKFSHHNKDF